MQVYVVANNKRLNLYRKLLDKTIKRLCSTIKTDKVFYTELVKHSTFMNQHSFECPSFPPGNYQIKTFEFGIEKYIPTVLPGTDDWRFDVRFRKNSKVLGGINIFITIKKPRLFG